MEGIKCRALGEVFECKGMKVRVARGITCYGCVFSTSIGCCAGNRGVCGIIGPCSRATREDNNDVIFMYVEG